MKIALIGWTSKYGAWWQEYFQKKWKEVLISSRSTKLTPKEAVKDADIIIFTVSIRYTVKTIKELLPHISEDKLVMDFTGIKKQATDELKKYTKWEVVATHPMFWPWIKSLEDQNIIYDPVFTGNKWNYIYDMWKKDGANLIKMTSQRHDEIVAIVQSSVHLVNLILWNILLKKWIDLKEIEKITTPVYRMQFSILSRFVSQQADLYADMQMENIPYKEEIIPLVRNYIDQAQNIIKSKDADQFNKNFNEIKNYIWQDFIDESIKITNKIDDILKND